MQVYLIVFIFHFRFQLYSCIVINFEGFFIYTWVIIDLIALLLQEPARTCWHSKWCYILAPLLDRGRENTPKKHTNIEILTEKTSAMVRFTMMDNVRSSTIRDYIASSCWTLNRTSTTIFSSSTSIVVYTVEQRLLVGELFSTPCLRKRWTACIRCIIDITGLNRGAGCSVDFIWFSANMCMSLRLAHELLACMHVILHDVILLDSQMTGLPGICKFNRPREARRGPDLFKPASCD